MANIQSQPKLKTQLLFIVLGLLTLLPWKESIKKAKPQWFVEWDELPLSSRKGWNRFWFAILLTTFSFFAIATFEQTIKPQNIPPQAIERVQEPNKPEDCPVNFSIRGIYCLIIKSELLKLAETFSIVVAAWIFILDRHDRKEQAQREYWSLIDGAKGSETSGARHNAISRLHQEKVPLKGLDAEGADLRGINLEGANLERSNLQRADLQDSTLINAYLVEANLQDTNLENAKLQGANLWLADLRGANLRNVNLQNSKLTAAKLHRASLRKANLQNADLRGSRFYYVDFRDTILDSTNLSSVEFFRVKNLTLEQIQKANNWELARFCNNWYPNIPRIEDNLLDKYPSPEILQNLQKIREIENIIDFLNQKTFMPEKEFQNFVKNQNFEIPEVNTLQELIVSLEDIQDSIQQKLEDLIEDIKQGLNIQKEINNN